MLVVLSEASFRDRSSINGRELHAITEAARLFGCRIYPLPPDSEDAGTVDEALAYLPVFDTPTVGIWVGYIPTPERYTAVYHAARAKQVRLVNTPEEYQRAMEFDRFYPFIRDLTPSSLVVTSLAELPSASTALGYPIFVKGAVKSNKEQGWQECVASNEQELQGLVEQLLRREGRSRGRVILRRLVPLRRIETSHTEFPLGREYRVFVYREQVLACGFYWDEHADAALLTRSERAEVEHLARLVAQRVQVPFIAVDIGQVDTGDWVVIEVGDGQFSGLSQVPVLELWAKLAEIGVDKNDGAA